MMALAGPIDRTQEDKEDGEQTEFGNGDRAKSLM